MTKNRSRANRYTLTGITRENLLWLKSTFVCLTANSDSNRFADRYTVVQKFGDCIECKNPLEIFAFNKKKQNFISKGTQTRDSI